MEQKCRGEIYRHLDKDAKLAFLRVHPRIAVSPYIQVMPPTNYKKKHSLFLVVDVCQKDGNLLLTLSLLH